MKIRTDFVTNSSSTSTVALHIYTKNGEDYQFIGSECSIREDDYTIPTVEAGKLVCEHWVDEIQDTQPMEITSILELMAILSNCTGIDFSDFEMIEQEYKKLLKEITQLNEIEKIEIIDSTADWDEFIDDESEMDEDGCQTSETSIVIDLSKLA